MRLQQDVAALYAALGLPVGAPLEQVEQTHRDLVKVWHPDRFGHDPKLQRKAEEKLKEINAAHDALRDAFAQGYRPISAGRASSTHPTLPPSPVETATRLQTEPTRQLVRPPTILNDQHQLRQHPNGDRVRP